MKKSPINCAILRHGETKGNKEKRYIGCRTDEPLSEEGALAISENEDIRPEDMVFISPMQRAAQTADIMFPGHDKKIIEELREADFGDFEGYNYKELDGNPEYQKWIDSNGTAPFPNGESIEAFRERSVQGFEKALRLALDRGCNSFFVVAHGGTVMSVLSRLTGKGYYDFMVPCGNGFKLELLAGIDDNGKTVYELKGYAPYGGVAS